MQESLFKLFSQLFLWLLVAFIIRIVFSFVIRKIKNDTSPYKKRSSIVTHNEQNSFPYEKRLSVMTPAEQKYFLQLEQTYGEKYYIFPQINLDKLIKVTEKNNYYQYFNKINRKSVDYVLADKSTLETIKVIELDDYTHKWDSRKKRDKQVNMIFQKANIPIEHIS